VPGKPLPIDGLHKGRDPMADDRPHVARADELAGICPQRLDDTMILRNTVSYAINKDLLKTR